jgi:ATP-dependent DNA ligase
VRTVEGSATASRHIVDAARRLKASSFLIDGEAMIIGGDGTPDFRAAAGAVRRCWWHST